EDAEKKATEERSRGRPSSVFCFVFLRGLCLEFRTFLGGEKGRRASLRAVIWWLPSRPENRKQEARVDYIIPSLSALLEPLRGCFRQEAFDNFRHVVAAWLLCPGTRPLSEVWQASSLSARLHFDAIYHLFSSASWGWDEVGALLCLMALAR